MLENVVILISMYRKKKKTSVMVDYCTILYLFLHTLHFEKLTEPGLHRLIL